MASLAASQDVGSHVPMPPSSTQQELQFLIPIAVLVVLLSAVLGLFYYRKRDGATWSIPSEVEGIRALPPATTGGVLGGIAAYLQAHDSDIPDYWTVWHMAFFGVIAALIGTFIISGTGTQKTIRCFTLAIIFGMVWPAVINLGESMALSKNNASSSDEQNEIAAKLATIANSPQMDPTTILSNPSDAKKDDATSISTVRSNTIWLLSNITLQEDRESKRESKELIYESLNQLYKLVGQTPEALRAWYAIRTEAYGLGCNGIIDNMDAQLSPKDLDELWKNYNAAVQTANTSYSKSASNVDGWFRLANLELNQTHFSTFLAENNDGTPITITEDGMTDWLTKTRGQSLILLTDVYLRTSAADPNAPNNTTLMPSICVMAEGTKVVVEDCKQVDFAAYKQIWAKVSVPKSSTMELQHETQPVNSE